MIQGGYSVNPHTGWFASPGIGHGDRFVLSDIDPDRPGLEVYAIQQSSLLGQILYDARTTERIKEWYLPSVYDVGRGTCLDMDASHKGYEILSYVDDYVYDCKVFDAKAPLTVYQDDKTLNGSVKTISRNHKQITVTIPGNGGLVIVGDKM